MKERITFGISASLTGRYATQGMQALVGVQAWVADTKRLGGVRLSSGGNGLPVELVHYDDRSSARRCAEVTERLIVEDRVDVLLGPYSSGLALRAASVAQRHRRLLWNHGGSLEAVHHQGSRWVVSILTPTSHYFRGVLDMALSVYPSTSRVAVIHSKAGAFPVEVASGAGAYCRELGLEHVRVYSYLREITDFVPAMREIMRARPNIVLGVGRIEDDVEMARQIARSGVDTGVVGLVATPLSLFRDALGDGAERFVGPSQWEPGLIARPDYGPTSDEVMESFRAKGVRDVDYPMAQAYAGCLAARRCIEETGSLDDDVLRRAASDLDFTTFYGRFKIEAVTGRQVGHVMPIVQWRSGHKEVVWPPEMRRHI